MASKKWNKERIACQRKNILKNLNEQEILTRKKLNKQELLTFNVKIIEPKIPFYRL